MNEAAPALVAQIRLRANGVFVGMVATLETIPDEAPAALRPYLAALPRSSDWYFATSSAAHAVMRIDASTQSGCLIEVFTHSSPAACPRTVIRELEETARRRQCRSMMWTTADTPRTLAMESVLADLGWDPGCRLRCFGFEFAAIAKAPWVKACAGARDCRIVPWTEVTEAQRGQIRAAELSPFPQERYLEPACSVALIHGEEVAGWSIATRDSAESVYIAVLWVREDLRSRGAGGRLIAETLRRGAGAGIRSATFEVEGHRTAMLRFADRHLRPYLSTDMNIYRTWKSL